MEQGLLRINKNLIFLLIIFMIGCFKEEELNNTPIDIPEYVGYFLYKDWEKDHYYVTVIDLEKDSIVGEHQVTTREYIESFCLGPDGMLYIPIDLKVFDYVPGNYVNIFDPEKGEVIGKIDVGINGPRIIHRLPNDEAFIFHYYKPAGYLDCVSTVIDLKTRSFRKKIVKDLGGPGNQEIFYSPDSSMICIIYNEPHPHFYRFYPVVDTLGEVYHFQWKYNDYAPSFCSVRFVTQNKIYVVGGAPSCFIVYDFPACSIKKFIQFDVLPIFILPLPNNKTYISHIIEPPQSGSGIIDNYISVVNTQTDEIIKKVYLGDFYGPYYMGYSYALNKVYIVSGYQHKIAVLNPDNDSVIKIISTAKNYEISGLKFIVNK